MVDIHCHILPELDDGATEVSVSHQMFEMAARDGIRDLVATPHSNYQYTFDPAVNRAKRDALQQAKGATPQLHLGCDFHLSFENIEHAKRDHTHFSINGTQYLLVEFADSNIPPHTEQIFFDMVSRGIVPIITHPERNPILADQPDLIAKWIGVGCLVQVTAGSVTGRFGKRAHRSTQTMLKREMVHFIATDAHNLTTRPPVLSEAREAIARDCSPEVASALSEANPRAAIEGRPIPWRPEPQAGAKRGWLSYFRK
jgi:protein-tyrosine phosphatase